MTGIVVDWAYLEDWCRRLTTDFQDVYVFTVPLYLPKQDPDGKWRVVSLLIILTLPSTIILV
jgi:endonuclease G